jgi:hypothetical protein
MKNLAFLISFSLISLTSLAQLPEDALRLSWFVPSGTARQQAIGGAMGSLGGDITATFVNPAGLGLYKTSEIVLSPGYRFFSNDIDYRGTATNGTSANNFNMGASGFVLGFAGGDPSNSSALSIAVNRTANFGSHVTYTGKNDYSSFSEQYAEEFANSGLSINDAINSPQLSYGTRMALYTYLVDTATIGGVTQVIGLPQNILSAGGSLQQTKVSNSSGGITEVAIALAGNSHDKWMYGGTIGIPIVNYTQDISFTETDATGDVNNYFASSTYTEHYHSSGGGINLKLGGIFMPDRSWRIGLAIHTPTWYTLNDDFSATMSTNTEQYTSNPQPINITSTDLDNATGGSISGLRYYVTSPWKFLISGTYLFGGGESDVKLQKGFITGDIEYVTTNSTRFSTSEDFADQNYYSGLNSAIKQLYKGAFNFRIGGEMKFNTFFARGGFAYTTNPYQGGQLKADQYFISGGVGYRNKGYFVDLAYVAGFGKNADFPYRLSDKANTYATLNQSGGTVLVTIGFKIP